jgi:hypothetical protein
MGRCSDSLPTPTHEAPQPPKAKMLQVNVSIKDTEVFKGVIAIIGELVIDERIPAIIRQEYIDKMVMLVQE